MIRRRRQQQVPRSCFAFQVLSIMVVVFVTLTDAFNFINSKNVQQSNLKNKHNTNDEDYTILSTTMLTTNAAHQSRREVIDRLMVTGTFTVGCGNLFYPIQTAVAADPIDTPKFVQQYQDFIENPQEGWSSRDVTVGTGPEAKIGDRVVFDWSGYTIGYFGRPFQAKGGPQGGAFDKDIDYARTVIGSGTMVKGMECGMVGMRAGGVRQIIVPYGDMSYPEDDLAHDRVGPKPITFSGQRALNFVLENPRVDRTLLFNVKVIRIDVPDGKGYFKRG